MQTIYYKNKKGNTLGFIIYAFVYIVNNYQQGHRQFDYYVIKPI